MPASFPVFRSGLVLESNLELSVDQARDGADFLQARHSTFLEALMTALDSINAKNPTLGEHRSNRRPRPDIDARSVRFEDIRFDYKRYHIEARVGFTLCEADRQSKVAVRLLCLEVDGAPARGLTTKQVGAFFHDARDIAIALKQSAAAGYEAGVRKFLAANPDILTTDKEVAHNAFVLDHLYEFNTRAYDSSDQMAFAMIEELSDGDALSDILERDDYRRVFRELWSVAHYDGEIEKIDADRALEALRSDDLLKMDVVDGAYVDHSESRFDEQRGLFVSEVIEEDGRPARIEYVGVMPETLAPDENAPDEVRRSPAFRLTHQVFAKFANQF